MWPHQNPGAGIPQSSAPNPNDWATAAQQWMNNKVFYEQWQQQQYQQHMQMMAASHAAQMAQSIDPTVIKNPPPPPPLPNTAEGTSETTLSLNLSVQEGNSEIRMNGTASKFKNQHLTNNPKTFQKLPYIGKDHSKVAIFAAYDKNSAISYGEVMDSSEITSSESPDKSQNSKQLPLWLREGLEKIKQEKQKKVDKQVKTEPKLSIESVFGDDNEDDDSEEEAVRQKKTKREQQSSIHLVDSKLKSLPTAFKNSKSATQAKLDSSQNTGFKQYGSSPNKQKIDLNDEEKQELIVSLLKQWMTDILLEVTNSEMQIVAKETINYEKDLRTRHQLKVTKASLNISYAADSDSDNSDNESSLSKKNPTSDEDVEYLRKRADTRLKEYKRKFLDEQDRQNELEKRKTSINSRSRSPKRSSRENRWSGRSRRSRSYSRSLSRSNGRKHERYRSRSCSSSYKKKKYRSRSETRSRSRSKSYRKKSQRYRSRSRSYKKKHSSKSSRRSYSSGASSSESTARSRSYSSDNSHSDSSRNSSSNVYKKSRKKSKKSKK